jgi:hypothetical protein
MEQQNSSDGVIVVASVVILVVLALVALTAWNTVSLLKIEADEIERNRLHLCYLTGLIYGKPDGDSLTVCDELRDHVENTAGAW